jgi:ABC-type Fe3+-hydroxamate transport system substrate-binding protein
MPLPLTCAASVPVCSATADPGTLARAEWIKFVAPFFNKEVEANQIFANISAAYNATKEAATAATAAGKKKVAWVAWSSFAGPGVVVYTTPYKSQYIRVRWGCDSAHCQCMAGGGAHAWG